MNKILRLLPALTGLFLSGCAGMNSDFEFDKPARDSGIWMSQADEMTLGNNANISTGKRAPLKAYRLLDTGNIRLAVQPVANGQSRSGRVQESAYLPSRTAAAGTALVQTVPTLMRTAETAVSCNTPRCYPEPSSAFRTPDSLLRVWLAPYISPDDNVHMGEIVYAVAKPTDWNGVL